ncbi:MAG: N-acetyltransferase [Amphiplicatus sp.]
MSAPPAVRRAESPADFRALTAMLREYAEELGVDLCFQNFAAELADPAAVYEAALIAGAADAPAGCVALKRLDARRCEMKRLYVRPAFRGTGLGRRLAEAIVAEARAKGCAEIVLDTLERLKPAVAMYESMGFTRAPAYYDNPEPDVVYMRLAL